MKSHFGLWVISNKIITRGRATDADGKPTNRVEERIRFRRRCIAKVEELKREASRRQDSLDTEAASFMLKEGEVLEPATQGGLRQQQVETLSTEEEEVNRPPASRPGSPLHPAPKKDKPQDDDSLPKSPRRCWWPACLEPAEYECKFCHK